MNISTGVESHNHMQIQNYSLEQKYTENTRASLGVKRFAFCMFKKTSEEVIWHSCMLQWNNALLFSL